MTQTLKTTGGQPITTTPKRTGRTLIAQTPRGTGGGSTVRVQRTRPPRGAQQLDATGGLRQTAPPACAQRGGTQAARMEGTGTTRTVECRSSRSWWPRGSG